MCGIAGLYNSKDHPDETISSMLDNMEHRGPDDVGILHQDSFSIGMRRLSIIDLEGGKQPIFNEDRSIAVVANGEIYNFNELRADLVAKGHQFKSNSDSEVLVHLYEEKGDDCVHFLRGMYAFAILDIKKRRLLLVRDRLGIKPLYYSYVNGTFLFASELNSLLQSKIIKHQNNQKGLLSFLLFGSVSEPYTMIEGVQSLPAAHKLVFQNNKITIDEYWKSLGRHLSYNNLKETIRNLLEEAVKIRLMSDVPLGIFLSGGIDSSIITGLASQSQPIQTFSITFDESKYDESKYSRLISDYFKTNHQELRLNADDFKNSYQSALEAMDQPTIDGINTYFISQAVKKAGITVALSGIGGDELFMGYEHFSRLPLLVNYKKFYPYFPKWLIQGICNLNQRSNRRQIKINEFIKHPDKYLHPYFWSRMLFFPKEISLIFGIEEKQIQEFLYEEQICLLKGFEAFENDPLNIQSLLELTHYMKNQLLRDTDAMGMRHSLEIRTPLLDHKLVEFIFTISGKNKYQKNRIKPLLVDSVKGLLPEEIVNRKKMGFTFPFQNWIRKYAIEEMALNLKSYQSKEVDFIWNQYQADRDIWARPWALYVVKKWIEKNRLCAV